VKGDPQFGFETGSGPCNLRAQGSGSDRQPDRPRGSQGDCRTKPDVVDGDRFETEAPGDRSEYENGFSRREGRADALPRPFGERQVGAARESPREPVEPAFWLSGYRSGEQTPASWPRAPDPEVKRLSPLATRQ
jgi:hypothetical protein